jgi:hypothetical protein
MIEAMAATEHHQDVADVVANELALLDPATRAWPDAVIGLLHEQFREFGASGRIWQRDGIAAQLAADPGGPVDVEEMRAERLGTDAILLTYLARRPDRTSLRSSIWVRDAGTWRLIFHQGTHSGNSPA